jgi:hypothetical protein
MNTLTRNALPIILTTALLCACGGGGGGGASGSTGGTGNTNPTGNTGGTGNPGNTGNSGNDGGTGTTGGNTNTGGDAGNTGGGDGNTPPDQTPQGPHNKAEGVYAGPLSGHDYHHVKALILEDGQYWSLYGEDAGSMFTVYGFVQGTGTASDGTYISDDLIDIGAAHLPIEGTMVASYDENAETFNETSTFDGIGERNFAGGRIPDSPYKYDVPASIDDVIGHWNGTSAAGLTVAIGIGENGELGILESGPNYSCTATGTIKPRASGKNVFDVSVTFGPAPCEMANETATGVAIMYPLTSTQQKQFIAAVISSSRSQGMAMFANPG